MIAFHAHRNGAAQTGGFWSQKYNRLSMPATKYNYGGRYENGRWKPVLKDEEPRIVIFSGQVWVSWDGGGPQAYNGQHNTTARVIKNGIVNDENSIGAMIGGKGPFSNDWISPISMQDVAEPGDFYELYVFVYSGDSWVDGNKLHTWWCGAAV